MGIRQSRKRHPDEPWRGRDPLAPSLTGLAFTYDNTSIIPYFPISPYPHPYTPMSRVPFWVPYSLRSYRQIDAFP